MPSRASVRPCSSTVWRRTRTIAVLDADWESRRGGACFAGSRLADGSTDHHASRLAFGTGLFDHDRAVEEGTDRGGVGAKMVCDLADGVDGSALGERQGEENLIGRVGVDGPLVHGLECEQLVHGLVRDVLRGLAALAQADEGRGNGAFVFGNQAKGSPLPRAGPANRLDLDSERSARVPAAAAWPGRAVARAMLSRRLATPAMPRMRRNDPRPVWIQALGMAGSIQASSRPPPLG